MRALAIIQRSTASGTGVIGIGVEPTRVPWTDKKSDLNNLVAIDENGDLVANSKMNVFVDMSFSIGNRDSGADNVVKSFLYVKDVEVEQGLQVKVLQNTGGVARVAALLNLEAGDIVSFRGSAQVEADIGVLASVTDVEEVNAICILSVLG